MLDALSAVMAQHFDLPSELWFKTIAFVLSDSIYSVCCSGGDLSWDRNAFGTLRLVSKSFNHTTVKVADLALAGRPWDKEEEDEPMDVGGGDSEMDKLRLIYDRFKLMNGIQSEHHKSARTFFSHLLSAYYDYVQLIRCCKALFWRLVIIPVHFNVATTIGAAYSQQLLKLMEQIRVLFPTAFLDIQSALDAVAVPEMAEKLRRDVERDWRFIISGLEIVYRCAQAVTRRDEWRSLDVSTEFIDYLNDLHAVMKASAELYTSALKDRVPGEFPAISELPGVRVAIELIVGNGHHHQALAGLVNSWT